MPQAIRYEVGQTVVFTVTFKAKVAGEATYQAIDPDVSVACAVTPPSGTPVEVTLTTTGDVGEYEGSVTVDEPGTWRGEATGEDSEAEVGVEEFFLVVRRSRAEQPSA